MKTLLILIAIISCISFQSSAQIQITFQNIYGDSLLDQAYSVRATNDGGFIVAGNTIYQGTAKSYLIKTNGNGNLEWAKSQGGISGDFAQDIVQTADGGYAYTGWGKSFGAGDDEVYLVKTDAGGNVSWAKSYGGTSIDRGRALRQTSDGGYIIAGHTNSFGLGVNDGYVIKTDADGDTLWVKSYGFTGGDNTWWIEETSDGGYIAAGNASFGAGYLNLYLLKLDASGDTTWTRTYGGLVGGTGGYCVKEIPDGGYVLTGWTNAFGEGDSDLILIRIDDSGSVVWAKTYGGTERDEGQSLVISGNTIIVAGKTRSFVPGTGSTDNGYLIATDMDGDTLWTKAVGGDGNDLLYSIEVSQSGFVAAGWTESFGDNSMQAYLLNLNLGGESGCNEFNTQTQVSEAAIETSSGETVPKYTTTLVTDAAMIETTLTPPDSSMCYLSTSIEENVANLELNVYPNPGSGNFNIGIGAPENSMVVIRLYNSVGQAVYSKANMRVQNGHSTIDLKSMLPGVYLLEAISGEVRASTRLVIIGER